MSGLGKRLAVVEARSDGSARLICIKGTDGVAMDTDKVLSTAGLTARPADTLVIINKPIGIGGEDRVLSCKETAR